MGKKAILRQLMEMSYLKWEYKTRGIELKGYFWAGSRLLPSPPMGKVENELNTLGGQGWELITVLPYSDTDAYANKGIAFFKRKKEKKD